MHATTNITKRDLLAFQLFQKKSRQKNRVVRAIFALAPPLALLALAKTSDTSEFLGEHDVDVADDGVNVTHNGKKTRHAWRQVLRVIADDDYCFIFFGPEAAVIIPRRSFEDLDEFRLFAKMAVISHWNDERNASNRPAALPAVSAPASSLISMGPVRSGLALATQESI